MNNIIKKISNKTIFLIIGLFLGIGTTYIFAFTGFNNAINENRLPTKSELESLKNTLETSKCITFSNRKSTTIIASGYCDSAGSGNNKDWACVKKWCTDLGNGWWSWHLAQWISKSGTLTHMADCYKWDYTTKCIHY